jgi:type IV pilus assembly protein PilB
MENTPIGVRLVKAGMATPEQVRQALDMQEREGGRLCGNLMRLGAVGKDALTDFFQKEFGFVPFRFDDIVVDPKATLKIPPEAARHHRMVPLEETGETLRIAFVEGSAPSPVLCRAVRELTGLEVEPVFMPEPLVLEALDNHYGAARHKGMQWRPSGEHMLVLRDESGEIQPLALDSLDATMLEIDWLRAVLAHAIRLKALEIRMEPGDKGLEVFFEMEGRKEKMLLVPDGLRAPLFAFLRRLTRYPDAPLSPGDAPARNPKAALQVGRRFLAMELRLRASAWGERVHIRLLGDSALENQTQRLFRNYPETRAWTDGLAEAQNGVWILSGPSGEAKQNFYDAMLAELARRRTPVVSLEKEFHQVLQGVRQAAWKPENRLGALEEILQEPPSLLALNDIEDAVEAEKAFLAGARMPVLAVLTAYDSFAALDWLLASRLRSPLKAGLCRGILSLRAFEPLCPHCAAHHDVAPTDREALAAWGFEDEVFFSSQGCMACRSGGTEKRFVVAECLDAGTVLPELLALPQRGADTLRERYLREQRPLIPRRALNESARRHLDIRSVLRSLPLF